MGSVRVVSYYFEDTLQRRCLEVLTQCLADGIRLNIVALPPSVMDELYPMLDHRGLINDDTIHLVLHAGSREARLADSAITERGIRHLSRCRSLRKLDLSSTMTMRSLDEQCFLELFSQLHWLEVVLLKGVAQISSEVLRCLVSNNPSIAVLDLGMCPLVDDAAVALVATACKRLTALDVSFTNVTDDGIAALVSAPCCRTLEELSLNGCERLTDRAIDDIVENCLKLSIVSFYKCPLVTDVDRSALARMEQPMLISWTVF